MALLPQSHTGLELRRSSFPHRCRCALDKAESRQMCLYAPGKRCGEGADKTVEKMPQNCSKALLEAVPVRKFLMSKQVII